MTSKPQDIPDMWGVMDALVATARFATCPDHVADATAASMSSSADQLSFCGRSLDPPRHRVSDIVGSMPDPNPGSRLVDQFRAASASCHQILAARLEVVGMFADLYWSAPGGLDLLAYCLAEPAFTIAGYSRWVAFQRLNEEIRYYAAALPAHTDVTKDAERDPARLAAIAAEADYSELGICPTVDDAVSFTEAYLSGLPLAQLKGKRVGSWSTFDAAGVHSRGPIG
jgi:hypothetical protein